MPRQSSVDPDRLKLNVAIQDAQVSFLKLLIELGGLTRAEVARYMHVSKRTVDAWMLPADSEGRRNMEVPQTMRLNELIQEMSLKRQYGVVTGVAAKRPVTLGSGALAFDFPAVFRSPEGSRSPFSFRPVGEEIRHLQPDDGAAWLQVSQHFCMYDLAVFMRGFRLWKNPFENELLDCCEYAGKYFSLIRLRPDEAYTIPSVLSYGMGSFEPASENEADDPWVCFDVGGRKLRFKFDVRVDGEAAT